MSTEPASFQHEKKILATILFLALALRLWGIQFGLPGLFHADEPIVLNHALAYGAGDFNPRFFKIPPLVSYLLFALFGAYYLAGKMLGRFSGTADFESLFYADPSSFYLLARLVFGALAGTLTVLAFYRVIRHHFGAARALTGAFLLAVCFLHVTDSHYLYADIPLVLVIVLAFGMLWAIKQDSVPFQHIAAGALMGLAAAIKYNGIFIGLFYGTMLLGIKLRLSQKIKYGLLAAGAAVLTFSLLNPYWLLDFSFFIKELKKQSLSQGGVGWLHHATYSLSGALGLPLIIAALAGILTIFFMNQSGEARLKRLALLFFTIGYYLVLVLAGQPYPRYVLLLLPGIIFFAADFLVFVSSKLRHRWIFAAGILLLSGFPLVKAILWCRLMSVQDTRTEAKFWVEEHLPSGSQLALDWDFYMPRLNFSRDQLEAKKLGAELVGGFDKTKIRRLDALSAKSLREPAYGLHFMVPKPQEQTRFLLATPVLPYDLDVLLSQGIQYVCVLPGIQQPQASLFYEQLARVGKLEQTFSPYRDGRLKPFDTTAMTGGPFTWAEIAHRYGNGQAIQIFRLEKREG